MSLTADPDTSSGLLRLLTGPADEAAWREFVARYTPLIDGCCRAARLQPADAEEVTSRVLARLVTALQEFRYDPARSFRGYLRTVVANVVRSYWRERGRPGATGAGGAEADAMTAAAVPDPLAALADSLDDAVTARLHALTRVIDRVRGEVEPDTWRAFWRTAVEGHRPADVARDMGKTVGAVYMAKSRVMERLREAGRAGEPPPEG